jgi:hypothetical protein
VLVFFNPLHDSGVSDVIAHPLVHCNPGKEEYRQVQPNITGAPAQNENVIELEHFQTIVQQPRQRKKGKR